MLTVTYLAAPGHLLLHALFHTDRSSKQRLPVQLKQVALGCSIGCLLQLVVTVIRRTYWQLLV